MANQFKESKDNPFHKEYGRWSNSGYILSKCIKYCPSAILIALLGVVCNSVGSYYLGIFGKFVIDVVTSPLDYNSQVRKLLVIIAIGATVAGIIKLGSIFASSKSWY